MRGNHLACAATQGYKAWGAMKNVMSNSRLGINAKKCLNEGVNAPTVLYGAEACGLRCAERKKVNVREIKCLRSLDIVTNG